MGLLDTIKSLFGLGGDDDRRRDEDVGVTVERDTREARTETESAVKTPADEAVEESEPVSSGTDAAASTGSMVDTPDDPDEAAEPAEAVDVTDAEDDEAEVDTQPPETGESAAAGSSAAASTGSMVDENTADEAAEPAEAVGVDAAAATDLDDEVGGSDTAETDPVEIEKAEDETDDADDGEGSAEANGDDEDAADEGESPDVIRGIGPAYSSRLADEGITTVAELAEADADEVAEAIDVSEKLVSQWIERAREH